MKLTQGLQWMGLGVMIGICYSPMTRAAEPVQPTEAPQAVATAAIGQMLWVNGKVTAMLPQAKPRVLDRRSPIYEHDTIITGADGTGQIEFIDQATLALRANTQLNIDSYSYQPSSPSEDSSILSIVKGGFRTVTGLIPKANPDGYAVKSPVATIGVRGTDYSAYYSDKDGLLTEIDAGVIDVYNERGHMVLTPCTVTHSTAACNQYGIVRLNMAPQPLAQAPQIFQSQPALHAVPPGGPGGPGSPPAGGSKTVKGFCVSVAGDPGVQLIRKLLC